MTAQADYLQWRRGAAIGCLFARVMSSHPENFGQKVEEIDADAPAAVAAQIAARIDQHVSDAQTVAAALVLPKMTTFRALTEMALALRPYPNWLITTRRLGAPPDADLIVVSMRRELPFGDETRPSEALGPVPIKLATTQFR